METVRMLNRLNEYADEKETGWIVWSDTLEMYAQIVNWKLAGMSQLQLKMFYQSDSRFAFKPKFPNIAAVATTINTITTTTRERCMHLTLHCILLHCHCISLRSNTNRFRNIQNYKHLYWCMHKCRRKFVSLTANFPFVHICYYPWMHLHWDSLPVFFSLSLSTIYSFSTISGWLAGTALISFDDDGIRDPENCEKWIISMRYLRDNIHHYTTIV